MSKYDEVFGKKTPQIEPQYTEFYGSLACDRCLGDVPMAKYYPNEGLLVWDCENGHRNYIENFSIG